MLRIGAELTEGLDATGEELMVDWQVLLDGAVMLATAGSGKTTLTGRLVQQVTSAGHPAFVFDLSGDLTERFSGAGVAPLPGFADDPDPSNPHVQLNSVDVLDVAGLLHRPTLGSANDETWLEEVVALSRAVLDALGYRVRGRTPEQALLEQIIWNGWTKGDDLRLADVAALVDMPPFTHLGVFDLDAAIRPDRRTDLAAAIRNIAPESGETESHAVLDLDELTRGPSGEAAAVIFSFPRRSHTERRFLLSMLLAKLETWVAARPDLGGFDGLVCIDDAADFIPAEGADYTVGLVRRMIEGWAKFGFGTLVTAEQAYELDPSVLAVCGTWFVGSTPVARARNAVVEELDLMSPPVDEIALDQTLKTLRPGQFVIRSLRSTLLRYVDMGL